MTTNRFQIGDSVWLGSGGPEMTVQGYQGQLVSVNWFQGNDIDGWRGPEYYQFHEDQLNGEAVPGVDE